MNTLQSSLVLRYGSLFLVGVLVLLSACQPSIDKTATDKPLAKVYNKTLYLSELDGMIPEGTTGEDSLLIINAYVERWVREALLLHEAEKNIPKDLNIDKLVRDYRASLIRHSYEKFLVESRMDSVVTPEQLLEFYEKNKVQYQLENPIVRCYFIKVPRSAPDSDDLRKWWKDCREDKQAYNQLLAYCNKYAEFHQLEDSTWYDVSEIVAAMPDGTVTADNIRSKQDFTHRDDTYQYFLKVFDILNSKEIAPLSYVAGQARRLILRQRQEKMLEDLQEDMYEVELRKHNVEIFTD